VVHAAGGRRQGHFHGHRVHLCSPGDRVSPRSAATGWTSGARRTTTGPTPRSRSSDAFAAGGRVTLAIVFGANGRAAPRGTNRRRGLRDGAFRPRTGPGTRRASRVCRRDRRSVRRITKIIGRSLAGRRRLPSGAASRLAGGSRPRLHRGPDDRCIAATQMPI